MKNKRYHRKGCILFTAIVFTSSLLMAGNNEVIPSKEEVVQKAARVQVPFIANEGQVDGAVKYYAKTFGGTVYVTGEGEILYVLPKYEETGKPRKDSALEGVKQGEPLTQRQESSVVLKEFLVGAKISGVKGEGESPTRVNYFKGNDPSQWRANIATYNYANLGEVYEGIELKLKVHGNNVEKLFCVKPGADPERITISLSVMPPGEALCGDGVKGLRVNEQGELEVGTPLGVVKFTKPVAYQDISGKRVDVDCKYVIYSEKSPSSAANRTNMDTGNGYEISHNYGFSIASYVARNDLIIDPLLASTYLGGSGSADIGYGIAIDSSNNVFVTGYTDSSNFPVPNGAYTSKVAAEDVFVSKFPNSLGTLTASTYLGGSGYDIGHGIAIDSSNNVFVTGYTGSSNFPVPNGAYTSNTAATDVFVSKFPNSLGTLTASTYLGGNSYDYGYGIAIDSSNNVFVTGYTSSSNFPVPNGAYTSSAGGSYDVFVSQFPNPLGTLTASTYLGGSNNDFGYGIARDSSNNIFVMGYTISSNFPVPNGAYTSKGTSEDVFVSKFPNSLGTLTASTYLGGSGTDVGNGIAIDSSNNVFITGYTDSSNFPVPNGAYTSKGTAEDVFVSKFPNSLGTLTTSTYLGGSNYDYGYAIARDSSNNVFVMGYTGSSNFPVPNGAYTSIDTADEVFVSKFGSITYVELVSFTCKSKKGGTVILAWETAAEVDNAGFNVYRKQGEKGEYRKLNNTLIPAKGSAFEGAVYKYTDKPEHGSVYYYQLEDVDLFGNSTMHGPVKKLLKRKGKIKS